MWKYLKNLACSVVTGSMLTTGLISATWIALSTQPALAITAGTSCSLLTDTSADRDGSNTDTSVSGLTGDGSCIQFGPVRVSGIVATDEGPVALALNTNNDGTPQWLDNFLISHHAGSLSNFTVNGVAVASDHQIKVTTSTTFSVQYDYGGSTYHFTTTVNPVTHTMSGFTIQAGAAPNTAPIISSSGGGATAAISIAENTTAVVDVSSTDADGETEGSGLTYALTGGADQGSFSIVPTTGVLTFTSAPDFESAGSANNDNDYVVEVTVTDGANATDIQTITVSVTDIDEEKPVIAAVANQSVNTDSGVNTASVSFSTTVSDNVDAAKIFTPEFKIGSSVITSPHAFPVGSTTVTVDANADTAGNTPDQVSFTVTVSDGEAPVISGVSDLTTATSAGGTVTLAATVSDNSGETIEPVFTAELGARESGSGQIVTSATVFPIGITQVTVNASDSQGNAAVPVTLKVTVTDNDAPLISGTSDLTTTTSAGGTVTLAATVTDNSGETIAPVFSVEASGGKRFINDGKFTNFSFIVTSATVFPIGITEVTVNASDSQGNAAVPVTFAVTVTDDDVPVISGAPADIELVTDAGQNTAVVTFTAPTVTDTTDGTITPVLVSSPTAGLNSGDAFPLGTTTMTYTATDAAGNEATPVSFTVTVIDNEAPVISGTSDLTTTLSSDLTRSTSPGGTVTLAATVTDNSGENIEPVFTAEFNDQVAFGSSTVVTSSTVFPLGETLVTVNATDSAGNEAEPVNFTVTVFDDGAPVIFGTSDLTTMASAGSTVMLAATVTDNSGLRITPVFTVDSDIVTSSTPFPLGETIVTVNATDIFGNMAAPVTFTVTVIDDVAPEISGISDLATTTSAGSTVNLAAVVTDNSGENIQPVFSVFLEPTGLAYLPVIVDSNTTFPVGVTTVVANASDSAGNEATPVTFKVTVTDDETPVFSGVPADINQGSDFGSDTATVNFTAPSVNDVADGAITPTLVSSPTAGLVSGSAFPIGVTTMTYTATDSAGNSETASFTITVFQSDNIAPTVTIGALAEQSDDTFTAMITLSEAAGNSTAFDVSDLTVVNASATLSGSGISFAAIVTPDAPGVEVSLSVPADAFSDAAGNMSIASNTVAATANAVEETTEVISNILEGRSQTIITHQPKIIRRIDRLNGRAGRLGRVSALGFTMQNNNLPFNADISRDGGRFSYSLNAFRAAKQGEAQNGFTLNPTNVISALGGGAPDMTGFDDAQGQIVIKPAMPLPYKTAANDNADQDIANERVKQAHSPLLSYAGNNNAAANGTAQPLRYDFWIEGVIGKQSTADGKGKFAIIHGGFDYLVTPNLLLGFGAQLDWSDYEAFAAPGKADGIGYMMGPYATLKLNENFYLDGRAAWGQSFNKISPLGTYEDDVTSSRILLSGAVIGNFDIGDYKLEPEIRVNYFKDTIDTYVDSLGSTIEGYEVETGTLEFGPSISRTVELENGLSLTPSIGLSGVWTFKSENTADTASSANTGADDTDLHARLAASLAVATQSNFTFTLSGSYDGIGNETYEAMTGALKVSKKW